MFVLAVTVLAIVLMLVLVLFLVPFGSGLYDFFHATPSSVEQQALKHTPGLAPRSLSLSWEAALVLQHYSSLAD